MNRDIFKETIKVLESLEGRLVEMGGPTSGHYGHAGRPGQRGGSAPSGAGSSAVGGQTSRIERMSANAQTRLSLTEEWADNFEESHGENEGPFWDTRGENKPYYYTARTRGGKLVAGATTVQKGLVTDLLSIGSHGPGQGKVILDEIKSRSLFIHILAGSPEAAKFFEKNGFIYNPKLGSHSHTWVRRMV